MKSAGCGQMRTAKNIRRILDRPADRRSHRPHRQRTERLEPAGLTFVGTLTDGGGFPFVRKRITSDASQHRQIDDNQDDLSRSVNNPEDRIGDRATADKAHEISARSASSAR